MVLLALPLGIILPTVSGWLMLRLLEWKTPVLARTERLVLGFVVGMTATMYLTFMAHVTAGLPLSFTGFLGVQLLLTILLGGLFLYAAPVGEEPKLSPRGMLSRWRLALIMILGVWTVLKIAAGTTMLTMTPTYFDDSIDNWNLRGKIIFVTHAYPLVLPFDEPGQVDGVSSYPPTVPMTKAWISSIAGQWQEGFVNSVQALYFLAVVALLFFALRRYLSLTWSLLGAYIVSSLPLFLLHGTATYAETFMAMHLFAAVSLLFHAARSNRQAEATSFLRLAALAGALLAFTKNEGFGLYLPPFLLLFGVTTWWLWKMSSTLTRRDVLTTLSVIGALLATVALPWTTYKLLNGMVFGNAHPLGTFALTIKPMALISIAITTFFEGNWLLLFPLLIGLLMLRCRSVIKSPLIIPVAFVLMAYGTQLFVFLFFSSLSTELIKQTGYARGVIHVLPIMTFIATMLLKQVLERQENG